MFISDLGVMLPHSTILSLAAGAYNQGLLSPGPWRAPVPEPGLGAGVPVDPGTGVLAPALLVI